MTTVGTEILTSRESPSLNRIVQSSNQLFVVSPCCGQYIHHMSGYKKDEWKCSASLTSVVQPLDPTGVRSVYDLPDDPRYSIEYWLHCWTHLDYEQFEVEVS